jgi:hypothetical protein
LPSRTQINLAFHQTSLHHQVGYALKVCEAPTCATRSKYVRLAETYTR